MVRFERVGLSYPGTAGRDGPEVLHDITCELPDGCFRWLLGPSGAGKTSLMRLMYLAVRPSRGRLDLLGTAVDHAPRRALVGLRRRIGVVFQDYRLLDHLSAFDNVALPLRIAGRRARDYRHDVAELLAWVGLKHRMHALPPTLSGGEKQRLAIARAVVNKPDILIADEPTGNVDQEMALRILRLFVELHRLGTTVLIASHDQALVNRSGMPVLHLTDGRLATLKAEGVSATA